ncbi:MAG: CPBP family intramembrane glutamic endopeptidase, partial [Ferruginibacter sp.]
GKKVFWLGFNKRINIWQILLGFAIMFVANLLANPLKEITEMALKHFPSVNANAVALEKQYNDQVTIISNLNNWGEYILSLIIIGFLPAMFEEMLFRGALQNLLNRWWKQAILSIIVSSLLFSLVHMSYFLFFSRAILGFALGWMFWRSKNIWVNIIAHFINNGLVLTVLFYESGKGAKPDIDKMDPAMPLWSAFVSLAILIALCWLFEKVSVKNRIAVELKESVLIKTHDDLYDFPEQKNMV